MDPVNTSLFEESEPNLRCPRCLHQHQDVRLAFICIGCPCEWTPPAPGSPRAEREKAERLRRMFEAETTSGPVQ